MLIWISGLGPTDTEVHADLGSIEITKAPAWDPGTSIDRESAAPVAEAKTVLEEPRRAGRSRPESAYRSGVDNTMKGVLMSAKTETESRPLRVLLAVLA